MWIISDISSKSSEFNKTNAKRKPVLSGTNDRRTMGYAFTTAETSECKSRTIDNKGPPARY